MTTYTGRLIRGAQQTHVARWMELVSNEVTGPQFGVLEALHQNPGLSQADLCAQLDLDRSTVADLVARMSDRGIITRIEHEEDKRRYSISLSSVGEAEYEKLVPKVENLDRELTKKLSQSEHDELQRLLKLVVS
jgi:DNA-binding MarR family transcriptional regulator